MMQIEFGKYFFIFPVIRVIKWPPSMWSCDSVHLSLASGYNRYEGPKGRPKTSSWAYNNVSWWAGQMIASVYINVAWGQWCNERSTITNTLITKQVNSIVLIVGCLFPFSFVLFVIWCSLFFAKLSILSTMHAMAILQERHSTNIIITLLELKEWTCIAHIVLLSTEDSTRATSILLV